MYPVLHVLLESWMLVTTMCFCPKPSGSAHNSVAMVSSSSFTLEHVTHHSSPFLSILEVYGHRVGSTWDLGSLHTVYHAILKCCSMIHETNTQKTCLGLRARTKHQIRQSSLLSFAQMVKRWLTRVWWSIEWVYCLIMHWHSGQIAGS